jgi:hypothetical protein
MKERPSDGDERVRGFCSVKEKGGAEASLWSWPNALNRLRQGKKGLCPGVCGGRVGGGQFRFFKGRGGCGSFDRKDSVRVFFVCPKLFSLNCLPLFSYKFFLCIYR